LSRYLVTGGAGFIGSHVCDRLVGEGHDVVILDDFSSGKHANLHGPASAAKLVPTDIRSGLDARAIGPCDGIIHLAALISGFDSLRSPDDYLQANLQGLLRVIDYAAEASVPRILFASSSTVYGSAAAPRLTEEALPRPMSVYAATKLMGEQLLAMYGRLHGFSHCSLRLFNVYGPRQATDHPYANVTCNFSHAAANGLPIALYGDGEQSRDFIYVEDVVDAFLAVLEASPSSLYNIGTGRETSIGKLIATLEGIAGRPFQINQQAEWPNDIRSISADCSRAAAEIGFAPRVSVEQGLANTVDFFHPQG
jgi:UDP-glucose 4-epimerase